MYLYITDTNEIKTLNLRLFINGQEIADVADDWIRCQFHAGDKRISYNEHMKMWACSEESYNEIAPLFYHIELVNFLFDELGWSNEQQESFMSQWDHLSLFECYYEATAALCDENYPY